MEPEAERKMKSDIANVVNYFEDSGLTDEELINLSKDMKRIAIDLATRACRDQILDLPCAVNINYHPDYLGEPDWRTYPSVKEAINELQIDLDTFSDDYLEYDQAKILTVLESEPDYLNN